MKYCPYCGATLVDSAASFCSECGKAMPVAGESSPSAQETPSQPRPEYQKPARAASWLPIFRKPRSALKKPVKRRPAPAQPEPRDEGYDGYYNDVEPLDNAHTRDRMNPELVKRILFIAAGALLIVILSVILLYVL